KAQVDHVDPLLGDPFERPDEGPAAGPVVRAQDADGDELRIGREGSDDPGTGRPVTNEIAWLGVLVDREVVAGPVDRDRANMAADRGVAGVDARVDDRDDDTLARRAAPGAFTVVLERRGVCHAQLAAIDE